jgi:hypothetical protein
MNARLDVCDRGLSLAFRGPGAVASGYTDVKKCVCEVSLNFEFELNTLGGLSVATYKNLNA